MNEFVALFKKELRCCFFSPIAFVVMFFFWVLTGVNFVFTIHKLSTGEPLTVATEMMFGGLIFFIQPFFVPLITMRLVAEERKLGTYESLLTTPLRISSFVLAKFFSALIFYVALWLPILVYALIASQLPGVESFPEAGTIASGFLGVTLVGSLYISVGLLVSCLTSNQIVAAISTLVILFATSFVFMMLAFNVQSSVMRTIGLYYSSYQHMMDFSRGVVDSRMVLMYLCNSAWVLFVSIKVVEAKRG